MAEGKRHIAILGSTGSIGTQALEVVRKHPELIGVSVLTANANYRMLAEQAMEFLPDTIVIGEEKYYEPLCELLKDYPVKVFAGESALEQVVEMDEPDMVLTAVVGSCGVKPTLNAIRAGKHIALANKETLVMAGEIITREAMKNRVMILPVDSEHSALFQCLVGEPVDALEKIWLTASGGPFRGYTAEELSAVTVEQALKHPNWDMGAKITIDSASMMNKGLEVIEARWLFNLKPEQIGVIVHPQSVIHSMVQFTDGSMKAQMGPPDMRVPIQYALMFPERPMNDLPRMDFGMYPNLSFEPADMEVFRNLKLAYEALEGGGNLGCILNAANEASVALFLERKIKFTDIAALNEAAMEKVAFIAHPGLEDLTGSDREAREFVKSEAAKLAV